MELAPSTEPWTAAVAWARPWRRPPASAAPEVIPPNPVQDAAWIVAVAELRAARESLASLESGLDIWLEALARQEVFRARRKLRRAQEALTGADADLPWSSG